MIRRGVLGYDYTLIRNPQKLIQVIIRAPFYSTPITPEWYFMKASSNSDSPGPWCKNFVGARVCVLGLLGGAGDLASWLYVGL